MSTTDNTTTEARTVAPTLEVDDVIRVPQYDGALKVTHVRLDIGLIGIEFVDEKKAARGALKNLVINQHSGNVALVAGTSDKGRVNTITIVTRGK